MFKINRKIEYALMALKYMNEKHPGELTTAKEICEKYKAPFDMTSRVLQTLSQKNLLRSEQGAHGGYQILKDLSKVSLFDLTEMLLGRVQFAECLHGDHSACELTDACNVISPIIYLNEKIKNLYCSISLRDLIDVQHASEKKIRLGHVPNTFVV